MQRQNAKEIAVTLWTKRENHSLLINRASRSTLAILPSWKIKRIDNPRQSV